MQEAAYGENGKQSYQNAISLRGKTAEQRIRTAYSLDGINFKKDKCYFKTEAEFSYLMSAKSADDIRRSILNQFGAKSENFANNFADFDNSHGFVGAMLEGETLNQSNYEPLAPYCFLYRLNNPDENYPTS